MAMKSARFGVVFDIDGVLMKSDKAIPEAHGALDLLHSIPKYVQLHQQDSYHPFASYQLEVTPLKLEKGRSIHCLTLSTRF
jgi:hypothetical protein